MYAKLPTGNYDSNSLEHIYIYMNLGQPCPYNTETFVNRITNGAEYGIQLSVECKTTTTYVETNLLLSKAATSFL